MEYVVVKWLHIVSATFLFGTGVGSAFYKYVIDRGGNIAAIAQVSVWVVRADWLFTAPTVVFQPLSGFYLVWLMGIPLSTPWVAWSLVLYILAGACWLPVVVLQIRMRDLALAAWREHNELPALYWRYARIWFWLGVPAFTMLVIVFFLMVARPA